MVSSLSVKTEEEKKNGTRLQGQGTPVPIVEPSNMLAAESHDHETGNASVSGPDASVSESVRMRVDRLNVHFADNCALADIDLSIQRNKITAIIGPSGCGKSTLIRCLNRMNDVIPSARITGRILLDNRNIYDPDYDPFELRKKVGMVFQKPNPFPKSIFENLAFGLKIHGMRNRAAIEQRVVQALRDAFLWDEVKDRLHDQAFSLSGGQQQRLCIARALAIQPEVILFDEPCSALDPISTAKIEELMVKLKDDYTIAIVTHNMQQAARISDFTAFLYLGQLVEFNPTSKLFTNPDDRRTEAYITGRFG